ncbi:MAG TPA: phosphatidylglycerol lysyltransferase domain-containing protein, partial [Acidimicrobiales bacterium]|nr:phosphatidylglycerol lysyltransferase domain-containing protein [Acidimicrobiales bacterium]
MGERSRSGHSAPAAHGILAATGRVAALVFGILLAVTVATGWLYWLRGPTAGWPGPLVNDALPLDELPGHAAMPILGFLLTVAAATSLVGLLARALNIDRISAALALAAGVGATFFLVDAFSLYVVRQVPLLAALHRAAGLQPIYLSATVAGLSGALLGRPTRGGFRWNQLLACLVALAGLDDLVTAVVPHLGRRTEVITNVAPSLRPELAAALIVPVGILLLMAARGLSRRRRPAYLLALGLLGASAALHLLKGSDYESAMISALLALLVFARRQDFTSPADPSVRSRAVARLLLMIAVAFAFGMIALFVNRTLADLPFNVASGLADTARALVGEPPSNSKFLPGSFPQLFPWAVMSIAAIGVIWAAEIWLAPWRHTLSESDQRRRRAAAIVRNWGVDTLAPFALRHDKALFFFQGGPGGPGGRAEAADQESDEVLIAYRVVRGIALISGEPIGPPRLLGQAIDAFTAYAHLRGWKMAMLGASDRVLEVAHERGLHVLYHGDEAVVDTKTFSLDGGDKRAVRQAVHRLERNGYRCEVLFAGAASASLRSELSRVERAWLNGRVRTGFSMELDDIFRLRGEDALFVIGRSPDGQVAGFLHVAVCRPGRALSLSSMPRLDGTPNGFNSWLIVQAIAWASAHDFDHFSLNFSPFARLLVERAERSVAARVEREALLQLKRALSLQLDNLLRFNRQFGPRSEPRFVIYERATDLPLVAIAAMAAEGYLPFADRAR